MRRFDIHDRTSGVLLHLTSLPGRHGSGDLGPDAIRFADDLARAGQRWWQMLPVGPVGYGNSPYSALSAFAGNGLFVSPEGLVEDGLLDAAAIAKPPRLPRHRVDYAATTRWRESLLRAAFDRFRTRPGQHRRGLERFAEAHAAWLEDWTTYASIKSAEGQRAWVDWPAPLRSRDRRALKAAQERLAGEIAFHRFVQYVFDRQFTRFREATAARGIGLIGDAPIFVAHDSADVWAHPELWKLDDRGQPTVVAGVPPDYFSTTGQRWGNPLYRWDRMQRGGFAWWVERIRTTLARFDAVRLDHFIGFHRAWEIDAREPTAVKGQFVPGPGEKLFDRLRTVLGDPLPLVAEDLGLVTPEVKALRDRYEFPGLRILQFAFGNDPSAPDFLPHRYTRNTVVYTGTHDNDTTVGWFRGGDNRTDQQVAREQATALAYVEGPADEIHWRMIRTAMLSVGNLAITPAQDLLGLGSDARMNRPGLAEGNWEWRLERPLDRATLARLRALTEVAGRTPPPPPPARKAASRKKPESRPIPRTRGARPPPGARAIGASKRNRNQH